MQADNITQLFHLLEAAPADEKGLALNSTFAIASVGIATLKMLETLLPAAAVEVENESKCLSGHFFTLLSHLESNRPLTPEVEGAMAGIVMGMQFQDRNTQIMENVVCILERYRSMLEEVCANIEEMRSGHENPAQDMSKAIQDILSSIRLGDIRARYLEALKKAKVTAVEELSLETDIQHANGIELF